MSFAPNRRPVGSGAGGMRLMSKAMPWVNGPNQRTPRPPSRRLPQLKKSLPTKWKWRSTGYPGRKPRDSVGWGSFISRFADIGRRRRHN
eukprot:1180271-Pyramimonas_sp.AAC.1